MGMIPCVLLAYMQHSAIRACVDSVVACDGRLSIRVVENPSDRTQNENSPYLKSLVARGDIDAYVLFSENISNNAIDIAMHDIFDDLKDSEFVVAGDCDIEVPVGTTGEQIDILRKNPEVFAVSTQVDTTHWQPAYAEAAQRYQAELVRGMSPERNYIATNMSGFWFTMFRTVDFLHTHATFRKNGIRFVDGQFQAYSREILGQRWAATKLHCGHDRNREQIDPLYSRSKGQAKLAFRTDSPEESNYSLYNHNRIASATITTRDGERNFVAEPMPTPSVKRHRVSWEQDPVYRDICNGELSLDVVRYRDRSPRLTDRPGLYLTRSGFPTSIRALGGDKSAILLGNVPKLPAFPAVFTAADMSDILDYLPRSDRNVCIAAIHAMLKPHGAATFLAFDIRCIAERLHSGDFDFFFPLMQRFQLGSVDRMLSGDAALAVAALLGNRRSAFSLQDLESALTASGFQDIEILPADKVLPRWQSSYKRLVRARKA